MPWVIRTPAWGAHRSVAGVRGLLEEAVACLGNHCPRARFLLHVRAALTAGASASSAAGRLPQDTCPCRRVAARAHRRTGVHEGAGELGTRGGVLERVDERL